jgi:hypothetical protein
MVTCKFLRHVKDPCSIKEILRRQLSKIFLAKFLQLCYEVPLLVTVRKLWWENQ